MCHCFGVFGEAVASLDLVALLVNARLDLVEGASVGSDE